MRIRATVMRAFREHYERKGHIEFTPPIFQPTQSEGGSTLFPVKFDEDTTLYLTQSAQLYSEAMIFALNNVYCIAPCFRAEKSKTSRHLCEFWMAEMESAWMDLDGLCKDVEELLTHIVSTILKEHRSDLELLERNIEKLEKVKAPFTRMTYKEALEFVNKNGMNIEFGKDLRTIEENIISKAHDTPVIITNYPKEIMAFYKPSDPKDPATALCLDVIAPEEYGEIIGGSQRDLDLESMKQALRHMGEDPSHYEWYFDSRRYGSVPHSGHGMGVERVVAWICGLDNIKDAIPFPRTIKRFTP